MKRHTPETGSSSFSPPDRHALRRMAGERSFQRGEAYFAGGQVVSLTEHEGTVTAKVEGTRAYRVKLWPEDGEPGFSCTCPVGQDGAFCKHCVAVGLAWLQQADPKAAGPAVTMDDVRAYLAARDKSALVDLLMEQAMDDDRLRQRLFLQAAVTGAEGPDVATYRRVIDEAVKAGDFVDYHDAYDYASGIEDAVDAIEGLLDTGHAAEVIELAEYALEAVEEAIGYVDDSDGNMGGILARLQDIHLKACRKARPDPEALARRLFHWELTTDWDTFGGAAETYADILGPKGLDVYRELVEAEWAGVPFLGPGQNDPEKYGRRFRITRIMETLARRTGDVEAIVAIRQRDLSSAYDYLRIAETYREAGKHDRALEWAARGVETFPERTDSRLREFLIEEYYRLGRHDDAMELVWAAFTELPGLDRYRDLKNHADRIDQWSAWRSRALEFIRQAVAEAKRATQRNRWAWSRPSDHSELVRIFLWEGDVEAAWQEASEGGCSDQLWLQLADQRAQDHPEDALPIYQRRVEPTLERKNNDAYSEAVELLKKIRRLMLRLDRQAEFERYLEAVRKAHKPKRNFMKLLNAVRW